MSSAHLYILSDACPSDWLTDGSDQTWHTIANLVHQSDPALNALLLEGRDHDEVLSHDILYHQLIARIENNLPDGKLRKWQSGRSKTAKANYRLAFCSAILSSIADFNLIISACSFQERTLRASKNALLKSYNSAIGGIEGRGIGFEEYKDSKDRLQMKHSFVNFYGYNEIEAPENQMLVLLLMSWFIADQFSFYCEDIVRSGRYGFDSLNLTVISDKLSGDDDFRRKSEKNLQNLIDPENDHNIVRLERSRASDTFSGDLLVDNLAGWMNSVMADPTGKYAHFARKLISSGSLAGWHILQESKNKLEAIPATERLERFS